jgi:uncharacterized protein YbbC (DUF1343 family)
MSRCFPGTVLFEGTNLSEGRGTTTPLEIIGAPDIDFNQILKKMSALKPEWMKGCILRLCQFEPTFDKHKGKICSGIQIHTDNRHYRHNEFKPYRLGALMLKAIRLTLPEYPLWRDFEFEYEANRLAIDLLNGSTYLREWVEDQSAYISDLDDHLNKDEVRWKEIREPFLLY